VEKLLHIGLSNALAASVLAMIAAGVGRVCGRPALVHSLWLLVLLKLVTPPLVTVPIPWPTSEAPAVEALPVLPTTEHSVVAARQLAPRPEVGLMPDVPVATPEPGPPAPKEDEPKALPESPTAARVMPSAPDEQAEQEPSASVSRPALAAFSWQQAATALWLAGSFFWFALAGLRVARFHRLLRQASPASPAVQDQARHLARRLGLPRCPSVWLVPGSLSPLLWALTGPPRLLMPAALLGRLSDQQRGTLLAHELAHLRRRDHWVRGLEMLVLGLYWWFPLVWWARWEIREAEEQCCDAWVVWALPAAARDYALAIVTTLDFLSGARPVVPLAASGIGPVHSLRRRLTMIMQGTTPRALSLAGFLGVLALAAVLLPWLPAPAQGEDPPARREGSPDRKPDPDRAAEIERARAEVRELTQRFRQMEEEMRAARDRLYQANERLAELEARARPDDPRGRRDPTGRDVGDRRLPGPGVPPRGAPPDQERRLQQMEQTLDVLMQQMQELRRELRREVPPGGERRPGGAPGRDGGRRVPPPPGRDGDRPPTPPPPERR
jgi:beta-lactamase regulating signal transducer with metallopeptidase domain